MKVKALQICGTGSGVGKSLLSAALCRIFRQDGIRVCPFKAQNMALNSYVTQGGGEIGRAQAVQAQAAGLEPMVDMNPILIKPSADRKAQIIIRGKPLTDMSVYSYVKYKKKARKIVEASYRRLASRFDLVVIEGAGSPAEINLRSHDIVNMAIAEYADASVILVGDIDKGGVFAWLVGTLELLTSGERARIKGFIINKFRGDKRLLRSGVRWLEKKTKIPVLGVVPYFKNIRIAEEDSVPLKRQSFKKQRHPGDMLDMVVIHLPHISNFTDFDALEREPDARLRYVQNPRELGTPDVIFLPGTKNTAADLGFLKKNGMLEAITDFMAKNSQANLIGICGGYQMLGLEIYDGKGVESGKEIIRGLGFLPVVTTFDKKKTLTRVVAQHQGTGDFVRGYEIHHGQTQLIQPSMSVFKVTERMGEKTPYFDGAASRDGRIWGTYVHGIFDADGFRRNFLNNVRRAKGLSPLEQTYYIDDEKEFDKLAALVRSNLGMKNVYSILGIKA